MKFIFDSSAIFRAIKENKVEFLAGNYTVTLARYELGNIIWKAYVQQSKISGQEQKLLAKTIKRTLSLMDLMDAANSEEAILETAVQYAITFYDASYVYFAQAKDLTLVTEDMRLIKKITGKAKVSTLADL